MEIATQKKILVQIFACALLVQTLVQTLAKAHRCERIGSTLNCEGAEGDFLRGVVDSADVVHIYVTNCDASHLSPDAFSAFPEVEVLVVLNTRLVMKENRFGKLERLQEIDLSRNAIPSLVPGVFENLRALKSIFLRENNVSEIRRGVFSRLRHLEKIDLSFNQIEMIESDAFVDLPSLKVLDLSGNRIGEGFAPAHMNVFPHQCIVCRPRNGSSVCAGGDFSSCNGSRSVDELFVRFPTHNLILKSNPLCQKLEGKWRTENDNARTANDSDISSDSCKVNFEGDCFAHESRRYFLMAVCKKSHEHYTSTPSNSFPPNSPSEEGEVTELVYTNIDNDAFQPHQKSVNDSGYGNVWITVYTILVCLLGIIIGRILPHAVQYVRRRLPRPGNKANQTTSSTQDEFQRQVELGCRILSEYLRDESTGSNAATLESIVTEESGEIKEEVPLVTRDQRSGGSGNEDGCLHDAVRRGNPEEVVALLVAGADKEKLDRDNKTPLLLAVEGRHLSIAEELIRRGARIDVVCDDGQTLLHIASSSDSTDIVDLLLNAGLDANATDKVGYTPLHNAARKGHLRVVKRLLKAQGVRDVNARSEKKTTALHQAAKGGHAETMALLVGAGADLRARNARGLRPLDVARERSQGFVEDLRRFIRERTRVSSS